MPRLSLLLAIVAAALASGCSRKPAFQTPAARVSTDGPPIAEVPLGNPPGMPVTVASEVRNPFEGDADAVLRGKTLFTAMNCSYCHGFGAPGLMGPPLNGRAWRYGGSPAELYKSIHDGRPQGMPAWGDRLPPQEIWRLVAYVESLGGATAPATPQMAKLAPPPPSSTGEQAAQQDSADTAGKSRDQANAASRPSS